MGKVYHIETISELKPSNIEGTGVFSTQKLNIGDIIITYHKIVTDEESMNSKYAHPTGAKIRRELSLPKDPSKSALIATDNSKYFNHSKANANLQKLEVTSNTMIYTVIKDINIGDELLYDYHTKESLKWDETANKITVSYSN